MHLTISAPISAEMRQYMANSSGVVLSSAFVLSRAARLDHHCETPLLTRPCQSRVSFDLHLLALGVFVADVKICHDRIGAGRKHFFDPGQLDRRAFPIRYDISAETLVVEMDHERRVIPPHEGVFQT